MLVTKILWWPKTWIYLRAKFPFQDIYSLVISPRPKTPTAEPYRYVPVNIPKGNACPLVYKNCFQVFVRKLAFLVASAFCDLGQLLIDCSGWFFFMFDEDYAVIHKSRICSWAKSGLKTILVSLLQFHIWIWQFSTLFNPIRAVSGHLVWVSVFGAVLKSMDSLVWCRLWGQ